VSFTFSDLLGKTIATKHFMAVKGINSFEFTTPSSGVYVALVLADGKSISEKVAVAR
jgi:hypothetical protein